jgi:quercetin dioxygenase-like cupin family protein
MRVIPAIGAQSHRGPEGWFTGTVWRDASPPGGSPDVAVSRVLFEPGARTHWHTHPEGQILHVITGTGRAQREGGQIVQIGPGDVVYFAPGERHWHGAAPDNPMVHLAINPATNSDGGTDWQEPVTDEQYATGE